MTTLHLRKSIGRSPLRRVFLLIPLVFGCFTLSQTAQAADETTSFGNTAEGVGALQSNTTGINNVAFGYQTLSHSTSASGNTATGFRALFVDTVGAKNTANGFEALFNNTTGGNNTANGADALVNNTTGNNNTATGFQALRSSTSGFINTTGNNNTANGSQALVNNTIGNDNTATGFQALYNNSDFGLIGSGNTANGSRALFNNDVGSNNTAIGFQALHNNFSTGSYNIALGFQAGFNLTYGANNIDIGNHGVAAEANTIRIGSAGQQFATFIAGIRGVTTGKVDAVAVVIDSAGQLGTVSSSRRFKKDIGPMDKASEAILGLKPVTFQYKSDSKGTPQFGLIAEEVVKVNPDLVVRDEKGEIYTVRYEAVNAMLLNEFLKEHRQVQALKSTAVKQDATIAALTASLKEQAAQIQKVNDKVELSERAPRTVLNNQ